MDRVAAARCLVRAIRLVQGDRSAQGGVLGCYSFGFKRGILQVLVELVYRSSSTGLQSRRRCGLFWSAIHAATALVFAQRNRFCLTAYRHEHTSSETLEGSVGSESVERDWPPGLHLVRGAYSPRPGGDYRFGVDTGLASGGADDGPGILFGCRGGFALVEAAFCLWATGIHSS